ncbi:MAG: metallopeptidase TldD-related protein [Deltaproteobacteria bacterium]|nr:metallopeptidase TldD-related protein [Deltaproteobacteria bacterium]
MTSSENSSAVAELLTLAEDVLARLTKGGASEAKVVARAGQDLSVRVRLDEVELVEEAGTRSLSVRAAKGKRVATAGTSDMTPAGIERVVRDALELCDLSQEDPYAGLPDPSELAIDVPDLALFDPACDGVRAAEAVARCQRAERAAREYDPRITNSEGASFGRASGAFAVATSGGFRGGYRGSYASLSVSPVADDADGKKRTSGYWTSRRQLALLEDEVAVGREAARRTLRMLGAKKIPTGSYPVVFERDAARSLIGNFAGCIVGDSIYRRSSYLLDRVGTQVASELLTIVDDPLIPSGPGSRPFDGDGLPSRRNAVVTAGKLETYLLDTYSARKLGLKSTGSAAGMTGTGAGTSNFVVKAGETPAADVIKQTKRGLYVTQMMGFGFNAVTGDFSRGASGYWIEDGELAYPVSEVTISLNFDKLLKSIDLLGDDLDFKSSIVVPSFRVAEMTVAGS